ncbi:MAG: metallophosphoesterase [Akkermansiaceae bacterium]
MITSSYTLVRSFILGSLLSSAVAVMAEEKKKEAGSFSIAAVADIQYADADPRGAREPREGIARIKNAISHWNKRDLDWGVVLGDIIDWDDIEYGKFPKQTVETTPKSWKNTRAILAAWNTLNVPNYKVLGNHDYYVPYKDADGLSKPASVFRAFGFKDKAYYEFAHKGYRFIVLDGDMSHLNHDIESEAYKEAKAHYDSLKGPARGIWSAGISTKQMDWLKEVLTDALNKNEPTVIMCHYPMHKPYGGHTLYNAAEMTTLLNQFPNVVMWLNGHNHAGGYANIEGRHHLNLKGMQNEAKNWYQIDFGSESITVYQAEDLEKPKYELKLRWPLNKGQKSQGEGK